MIYIVTGVSQGLGKAITNSALNSGFQVIGIGRSHSFDHPNFKFISCDLLDKKAVSQLCFEKINGPVTLINNAGIIGEINRLMELNPQNLLDVMQVNVFSLFQITQTLYNSLENKDDFTLVNISSGAANRTIPSWGAYCASKSALNMLTEAFFLEEKEKGYNPKVYAVSPGVIDTQMQAQIRSVPGEIFSGVDNFIRLHENNEIKCTMLI